MASDLTKLLQQVAAASAILLIFAHSPGFAKPSAGDVVKASCGGALLELKCLSADDRTCTSSALGFTLNGRTRKVSTWRKTSEYPTGFACVIGKADPIVFVEFTYGYVNGMDSRIEEFSKDGASLYGRNYGREMERLGLSPYSQQHYYTIIDTNLPNSPKP